MYADRVTRFTDIATQLAKKLLFSSTLRFGLFVLGALLVYFLRANWQVALLTGVFVFALFLWLVSRHENLKRKKAFHDALVNLNALELRVEHGDYTDLATGEEFVNPTHEYSNDIDLFGQRSFFQFLNRTATVQGKETLAQLLAANNTSDIVQRQEAIQELAQKIDFRQEFTATAQLLENQKRPEHILKWLNDYKPFAPSWCRWLPWGLFAVSVTTITAYMLDVVTGYVPAAVFGIGLIITGNYVKKVSALAQNLTVLEQFFNQYGKLIFLIEKEVFTSAYLSSLKVAVETNDAPASARFAALAAAIGRLDQRNNMLFGFLANGLALWDLKQIHTIELWLLENATHVANWIKTVAFVDAYNSLGTYAFNHPHHIFPKISTGDFELHATDSKHPLLDPKKAVGNDIAINSGTFFIITGANMAGKSTFLRTVSMNIVLANVGLPLWASGASYSPIKLITSMRTSDSLTDEASYFFSELTRLKYIVDKIEGDRYFIVLDEILKGTNSQDKANGSRKLIEKLSKKHATGIIATHDLSLTEVAHEYDSIANYFFDAEIVNDELHFDYTFKKGVAQNMNASFLLRKMGIVD